MMDQESQEAAATLYRLAQAEALLRMYREREGRHATSPSALAAWAKQHLTGKVKPTPADHDAVRRAQPELVRLADRGNPYLVGRN